MAFQKRPSEPVELDPDATAELPIIDFDETGTMAIDSLPESAVATDVFPVQVIPAGVADLADSLREVEQRLERKIERVRKLEAELSAAHLQIEELRAERDEAHRSGAEREALLRAELAALSQGGLDQQARIDSLQGELAESRAQLQAQHAALTDSQQQAQQRASRQRDMERDVTDLRHRNEQQHEALSTWQGFRAYSESLLAQAEAQLDGLDAVHAASLQEVRNECSRLREELAGVQQQSANAMEGLRQSLQAAELLQQERSAELAVAAERAGELVSALAASQAAHAETGQQLEQLRVLEEKARQGAELFDEHQRQIAALQAQVAAALEAQRETQARLHKASERVKRLEADAHAGAAVLGNLQLNMKRLGREDTGSTGNQAAPQVPAGGLTVLRVLIRQEGGSDVVYPISRRTSVGRTPDNDIQVDASWISRHHAVLLSSPDHCIVEDLNSTNGVLVNGRRVGRQILQDGDTVTVGKTEFRYQQRS
jgi:chromosome segregation ATPase